MNVQQMTSNVKEVMAWFNVQSIACSVLQFLCNNCRFSNVIENIHEAKMLQPRIFSITLERLQFRTKIAAHFTQ